MREKSLWLGVWDPNATREQSSWRKQSCAHGTLNREDGRLQSQNTSSLFSNTGKHMLAFKHIKCICLNVKYVHKSHTEAPRSGLRFFTPCYISIPFSLLENLPRRDLLWTVQRLPCHLVFCVSLSWLNWECRFYIDYGSKICSSTFSEAIASINT